MKKAILWSSLFLNILFLSGCSNKSSFYSKETILMPVSANSHTSVASSSYDNPASALLFAAEPVFDENGWKARLELTIENGSIQSADFDYFNLDELRKSEDTLLNEELVSLTGVSLNDILTSIEDQFLTSQNATDITVVKGAEAILEDFLTLYNKLFSDIKDAQ